MIGSVRSAFMCLGLMGLLSVGTINAQSANEIDTVRVDSSLQARIIDSLASAYNRSYVFPDVARAMERHVRDRFQHGDYRSLTRLSDFVHTLQADMVEISKDKHIYIDVGDTIPAYYQSIDSLPPDEKARYLADEARINYGFAKVERMDGNVGYVELTEFADPRLGGPTAIAAMSFLSNCDAIIFDLRRNGGGDGTMGHFLSTYFFDTQVHLSSIYWRNTDTVEQGWTAAYVPGKRMPGVPLYILTSTATFSAAEAFTTDLQARKRAVVVGERTRGGGHPITVEPLKGLHLYVSIPTGNTINTVTRKSFESVGIVPDIPAPWDKALETAYDEALKQLRARTTDKTRMFELNWYIEANNTVAHPFPVDAKTMKKYVGTYGERTITFESGALYCQRQGRPRYRLIPMSADTFTLENKDMRVKFNPADAGVMAMTCLWNDGTSASSLRSTR
jgi:hypothetical protein